MNRNPIRIEKFKNISYVKDQKGRLLSFHSRYASCFIITLKGRLRFTFGDETVITDSGRGVFIPQGTAYTNECLESAESISVNFFISDTAARPCALGSINEKWALSFYEEFSQKAYEKTESAHYYLLSRLYQLAFLLFKSEKPRSEKERLGEKAFSHMQSECGRADLQIHEVAAFCNVSAVYLRKVMKELYEKTPFQLLTEMRMKKACEMLQEQRPVKEIALSVGYSDIYQFSRAFKRYFGYPPTLSQNR
ncbi:MAG: helix-turn-helix domain-containing protein [Clostridia bacterium]|nr:helix-turn-helix domain-containing protein [Clostridia bacterium]